MEEATTKKEYTDEDVVKAFLNIHANILLNLYANENVVFGRIKVNDEVPIKQYLYEIGFCNMEKHIDDFFWDGENVENRCITERDFNERCFDLYKSKIDSLFTKMPINKSLDDDFDIHHYKHGWYEYLKNLYSLFEKIIKTEVTPDLFAAVPDILDVDERRNYYIAASKFVLAIKTKGLRQGGRIDRYIKKMNFISPIIRRLIIFRKGHYCLKNSDIHSFDYKFALLSCLWFMNENNAKLFELKILQFEENNNLNTKE